MANGPSILYYIDAQSALSVLNSTETSVSCSVTPQRQKQCLNAISTESNRELFDVYQHLRSEGGVKASLAEEIDTHLRSDFNAHITSQVNSTRPH